jgi:hypothetical protein
MNIDKLIESAKKIDQLAQQQEERSKAWQQLAKDAREGLDRKEVERRKRELDASRVIDFGTAIAELRAALRAK